MAQTVSTSNDNFTTLNDKGDSVGGDIGPKQDAVLDGSSATSSTKREGVTAMKKRTGAGVVFIRRQRKSNVIPMSGFACITTDEDMTRKNCILGSSTSTGGRRIRAENGGSGRSGRREGAMKAQWTVAGNSGGGRVIGMKRMVVGRWDRNSTMFTMLVTAGVFFFLSQSVSLAEAMMISSNVEEEVTTTLKLHHISDEIPIAPDVTGIKSISDDVLKKEDFLLPPESKEAGMASGTVTYEKVRIQSRPPCPLSTYYHESQYHDVY
jgi:hypothetical protein